MLLDVNCILAIAWPNHQYHGLVTNWFEKLSQEEWYTCAVTELGFIRLSSNPAFTKEHVTPPQAVALLNELKNCGNHRYIDRCVSPCSFDAMSSLMVQGHRQITDCYLLNLAKANNIALASLDKRLQYLPNAENCVFLS